MRSECDGCGSSNISRNEAEVLCSDCGMVLESERIDTSQEYRVFDETDKEKKRAGSQVTFTRDDKGIGGQMGGGSDMHNVPGHKRGKYYRMKKWDKRSQKTSDREILKSMNDVISLLDLPDMVAEEAGRICSKARENDLIQGRSNRVISASIVYLVARNNGVPRTVEETADCIGVEEKKLAKNYRYVAREMDLGIKPVDPRKLLPRFANELGISGEVQAEVRSVISRCKERQLTVGRKPASVVSGAMYFVVRDRDDLDITQRDVALACSVTTVTVRKLSQALEDEFGEDEEKKKKEVSVKNV
jgi:transcription initiation factor TFIIB